MKWAGRCTPRIMTAQCATVARSWPCVIFMPGIPSDVSLPFWPPCCENTSAAAITPFRRHLARTRVHRKVV